MPYYPPAGVTSSNLYGIAGTQSTGNTTGTEKGSVYVDPTGFSTVTFRAILACSLGGGSQVCTLELFDIANNKTVQSLTTSQNVDTVVSVSITVGAGAGQLSATPGQYSLRLSRTGGTATDLVSCSMATIKMG